MVLDRREPFRRVRLNIFNKKFFWDTLTITALNSNYDYFKVVYNGK